MDVEDATIYSKHNVDASPTRTERIIEQLSSLQYECANCLNIIRRDVAVFSCGICYRIFHLFCIKQWARKSESGAGLSFRCPHCQAIQTADLKYYCFCGKQRDPKHDPHVTPHSCGQVCEKPRPCACPHSCTLLCHPGPCPPCSVIVGPRPCGCGASSYTWVCGHPDPLKSCGGPCGKPLSCGEHNCQAVCHHGACGACAERVMVTCYCGVERGEMPCGTEGFSCGRPCGRELKCGAHRCGALCHAGPCPSCEGDPSVVTTCPCGSTPLAVARVRCSDPIPTCGAVCDRWLGCGKHRCEAQCHAGKCQPCNQQQATQCPCGLTKASVPCGTQNEFRCDKVCKTRLSCGKHDCRERCCPSRKNPGDSAHRCRYICNKKLSCGHKCMELCHRGACPVCPRLVAERLECRCGAEVLMPPQACGTKPPPCRKPCNIPQPCGHHTVVHNCHYGDCPPCMFPTERLCAGGHKVVGNVPCSAEVATCNGKCEKSIVCGHKCERPCHPGPCVDEKHPCRQPCGKIHELCGHMCTANCHVSKSCPKCTKKVESRCECGRQTKQISCEKLLSLKRRDPSQTYEVHCDAECLFEQRLNILSARIKPPPPLKYSIFLWEAATANLDQVKKIEKALNDFVESGGGLSCLGAMPAAKRAIVHGLCYYYRITSESVDPEPRRSCVLRRTAETRIPKPLLSVAVTIPEVHSPLCFVERVRQRGEMMSTHVVTVRGEYANPIAVAHVLRDFAGDFIWVEEESDRGAPELLLYFTSHAKQREAHRHLQSVRPSFEFSIGSTPEGSKLKSKTSTSGAFSWARLAGGKK